MFGTVGVAELVLVFAIFVGAIVVAIYSIIRRRKSKRGGGTPSN